MYLVNAAKLQIIQAETPGGFSHWVRGNYLKDTNVLCPGALFPAFSVTCIPDHPASWAKFSVNGSYLRKESVVPYMLFGDDGNTAVAWKILPTSATIKCCTSNGEEVEVKIIFRCPETESEPTPTTNLSPSPTIPYMKITMPPSISMVPGKRIRATRTPAPSVFPSEPTSCVRIAATDYNMTSTGWVKKGHGMAFKPNDSSRGIDQPGKYSLSFSFVASDTAHHAFTLDMKTSGSVDHNDVWVEFPDGGFTLLRKGSSKNVSGWIKAYHNKNGRETSAYSVDFVPHYFSTRKILKAERKYWVNVSGRSTMVALFQIIMFPCLSEKCFTGSYYKRGVENCSV